MGNEPGMFTDEEHLNLSYGLIHIGDLGGRDRCNRLISGMARERMELRRRVRELESIQNDPHRGMLLKLLWEASGMEVEASYTAMAERELCEKAYELLSGKRWSEGSP